MTARIRRNGWYEYRGLEQPYLRHTPVKAVQPLGRGRWEVAPWIEQNRQVSWVTSDPLTTDLHPWPAGQPLPQEGD